MNLYMRLLLMRLTTRRRGPMSLWDRGVLRFRVTPADLDFFMHVNNARYLSLMDLGRLDVLMRSGLWAKLHQQKWYPVVAGQTITYRRSLKLGQSFELHTHILGLDERWSYTEQTFISGGEVCAKALVRGRFLRRSGGSVDHDELEPVLGGFPPRERLPAWAAAWSAATRISQDQGGWAQDPRGAAGTGPADA